MPADLVLKLEQPSVTSRVRIARGALARLGRSTGDVLGVRRVAVVSDTRVARLYGGRALRSLRRSGIAAEMIVVPVGERAKSAVQLSRLWEAFADLGLGRDDGVVALGGGVVGDLAGFAAASWLRGVVWAMVPTSLVAQVDSAVGGKTAIDLAGGKNLAGAFHQPRLVLVDPELLVTLAPRQRRAGLAEVVKTGMAADAPLFAWTERNAERLLQGDARALEEAVRRSLGAKLRVVRSDERERADGPRTALNYGHTAGHALESALGYRRLLHGEAVALGMRVAGLLSAVAGDLTARALERQERLLDRLRLPRRMPGVSAAALLAAMGRDKKRRGGEVRWVLTPRIGHASVPRPIPKRLVRAALREVGARA